MPHFQIDYSGNLEDVVDMSCFCEEIRREAAMIAAFPLPGIRVRATRVDHYAIADGNAKHGYIDISIRLREGRSEDVKQDAVTRIFNTAKAFLEPAMATHSIALSMEIRDIDAALSPKFGTIRNNLQDNLRDNLEIKS